MNMIRCTLVIVSIGYVTPLLAAQDAVPLPKLDKRFQAPVQQVVAKPVARIGPAKVAVLTSQEADAARNVQDLALVKLSEDKNLTLLDRAAVERILQEQKLSLSGLVDADTAVRAGKILAVDLLAVIDYSSAIKKNTGVVIFDAASGVRLNDIGFDRPDADQQARETAAGVRLAVEKWRAGTKHLKTVCFLPVRNADLPRHLDPLCETMSAMLERQLLHHPAIVTLERKRLDGVSKEKALSTEAATRELLASVLLIEMEVGKAQKTDGLRVTVTIRDNARKELHKIAHEVADPNGAGLLDAILPRVQTALNTVQVKATAKLDREARRFLAESELLWKIHHYPKALQAAEAAYALKANDQARRQLGLYLSDYSYELLRPGILAAARATLAPVEASPETVRTVLAITRRANLLLDVRRPNQEIWTEIVDTTSTYGLMHVMSDLQTLKMQPADAQTQKEIRAFQDDSMQRTLERVKDAARRFGPNGTANLTTALDQYYMPHFARCGTDSSATAAAMREALTVWLEHTRNIQAEAFPLDSASTFGRRLLVYLDRTAVGGKPHVAADREKSLPLLKAFKEHPAPLVRLYASHARVRQLLKLERISIVDAQKNHHQLIDEAKDMIDKAPPKDAAKLRIAYYGFLAHILEPPQQLGNRAADAKQSWDEFVAITEFSLQRRDVVASFWIHAGYQLISRKEGHAEALHLLRRMEDMVDKPPHRVFSDPQKDLKKNLKRARFFLLQRSPQLDIDRPVPVWDKVTVLADLKSLTRAHALLAPIRHGDHVYVFAGCTELDSNRPYLQLVRASLDGSPPKELGKAFVTVKDLVERDPKVVFEYYPRFITESVIHRDHVYAGTINDGIYVFPLAGGDAKRIGPKEGLPSSDVVSLTALDGKLMAALADGYLVVYDIDAKRTDVIASSRRTESQSPFDNNKPFTAGGLVPDPDRQRVIFRLLQITDKHPNTGTWEYNLKTRQFKKLLPFALYKSSNVRDGKFAMQWRTWSVVQHEGKPAWQNHDSLALFDMTKDRFTLLEGKIPEGMEEQKPAGLPADFAAAFFVQPGGEACRLYHGGYRWLGSPFGRTPIKGGKTELLPHAVTKDWIQVHFGECLEAISPTELLLGERRGLYVIRLKN